MASEPLQMNVSVAPPQPRRVPKGPARPILEGVGLDAPFFADKNRAFWVLQSVGWGGYFILRTLSGIANAMEWSFVLSIIQSHQEYRS